jgi:uncharacterized protein (TIGR00369 family)
MTAQDIDGETTRERTFSWDDPAAIAAGRVGLSGAEFLSAMAEGRLPAPPLARALDLDLTGLGDGTAVFRLTPQEFHYNPIGSVHGGVLAALVDSACGCAVHTRLPPGHHYTSLDLSLKFLRPVSIETGPVSAQGTVVHLGRRTALAEARVTDDAGKVYVTATSSCLVIRPEGAPGGTAASRPRSE